MKAYFQVGNIYFTSRGLEVVKSNDGNRVFLTVFEKGKGENPHVYGVLLEGDTQKETWNKSYRDRFCSYYDAEKREWHVYPDELDKVGFLITQLAFLGLKEAETRAR